MNILLLNPAIQKGSKYIKELGRCGRKSIAGEMWPQTGLACLAAVLEKDGHKVRIIDNMIEQIDIKPLINQIQAFKPQIIIVHATTPTYTNDINVLKQIKQNLTSFIGLVGTHVSILPEESLLESEADFILINEAEYTLKELVNNLNSPWDSIQGLCFKKNNKIIKTNPRPQIANLDQLPIPARHLLQNKKYTMPIINGNPFATIIASRGCKFQCLFCRSHKIWGSKVRMHSPNKIIEEIKEIKYNLGLNFIVFLTDTFTINQEWVISLCTKIIDQKINIKWLCNSRTDTINEEMIQLMKKAGCIFMSFGIESGSQEILNNSKKGTTLKQAEQAIKLTKKFGIESLAYFIFGLPGETHSTINKTIEFCRKINPDYAYFHIATPFPGTELYTIAQQNKWLISDNWEDFEEVSSAIIKTPMLNPSDLMKAQKKAMQKFYFSPKKIIKQFFRIKSLCSLKACIKLGLKLLK
jgi:anaerobic magnesium-protoporphyrin IX monomethyl ester cyclase